MNKAFDFNLQDKNGKFHRLSDYKGKKVVVYFYPKDSTSGCTNQALEYKKLNDEYLDNNTVIIGISKDSINSHNKFASKYELPFILLSDPNLEAIKAFDVYKEKKLYGKSYMGVVRSSFIIDEDGYIIKSNINVNSKEDASNNLCEIKR